METELSELEIMEQETFEEDDSIDLPPPDVVAYNELRSCADLFRMYKDGILFKPTIVMSEDSEHTSLVYQRFNILIIVTQALQAIRDYLKAKESQGVKGIPNIQKIIDDVESQLLVLK